MLFETPLRSQWERVTGKVNLTSGTATLCTSIRLTTGQVAMDHQRYMQRLEALDPDM